MNTHTYTTLRKERGARYVWVVICACRHIYFSVYVCTYVQNVEDPVNCMYGSMYVCMYVCICNKFSPLYFLPYFIKTIRRYTHTYKHGLFIRLGWLVSGLDRVHFDSCECEDFSPSVGGPRSPGHSGLVLGVWVVCMCVCAVPLILFTAFSIYFFSTAQKHACIHTYIHTYIHT